MFERPLPIEQPSQPSTNFQIDFQLQQMAQEFRLELLNREAFERHCEWYELMARANQQDLETMRREFDIFRWFTGSPPWKKRETS